MEIRFGVIGSGSWATALVKVLSDNGHVLNWWIRNQDIIDHVNQWNHNPHYLSSATLDPAKLRMTKALEVVIRESDVIVIAVPSAFVVEVFQSVKAADLKGKKIISAVKGILPEQNVLLNTFFESEYGFPLENYFAVLGPCHAEEVAAEKLSYLTFSGKDIEYAITIAGCFKRYYINTIINNDIIGVQYAAVLKNIYALGAGIAHGLDYGDNFLSVYIANAADEMAGFLRKAGIEHIEVGVHDGEDPINHLKTANYAASVYLGDLLVTCYSLFSRNRTFGNMIGKGYSVQSALLEMNMVAEGYNASKCMFNINQQFKAEMPIAESIYKILWQKVKAADGFKLIEKELV